MVGQELTAINRAAIHQLAIEGIAGWRRDRVGRSLLAQDKADVAGGRIGKGVDIVGPIGRHIAGAVWVNIHAVEPDRSQIRIERIGEVDHLAAPSGRSKRSPHPHREWLNHKLLVAEYPDVAAVHCIERVCRGRHYSTS